MSKGGAQMQHKNIFMELQRHKARNGYLKNGAVEENVGCIK